MSLGDAAHRAEAEFFRTLNRLVEPLVRKGLGSPRLAPGGLIVLETRGRNSGRHYRTPLAATRLGGYVLVATYRGGRSQWVRNLARQRRVRYWLGGRERKGRPYVLHPDKRFREPRSLPEPARRLLRVLEPFTGLGWAFALLAPVDGAGRAAGSG